MKSTFFSIAALFITATSVHAATSEDLAFESSPMKIVQIKPLAFDTIPAKDGVIKITPILHASIQIEYRGKVILVDPIAAYAGNYKKEADVVLITHSHPDHFDPLALLDLTSKPNSVMIIPRSKEFVDAMMRSKVKAFTPFTELANGKRATVAGFSIEAVPAYNIVRGPKPGQKFHPKGDGNGYILTLGGKRIYIAGDTEATPEMEALKNIDAAFIPMNLPYTMTPQEAAIGVRAFKPRVVYPYHFRYPFNVANSNPQQFAAALKGTNIQVRVLDWYNAAPVARFMAAAKAQG